MGWVDEGWVEGWPAGIEKEGYCPWAFGFMMQQRPPRTTPTGDRAAQTRRMSTSWWGGHEAWASAVETKKRQETTHALPGPFVGRRLRATPRGTLALTRKPQSRAKAGPPRSHTPTGPWGERPCSCVRGVCGRPRWIRRSFPRPKGFFSAPCDTRCDVDVDSPTYSVHTHTHRRATHPGLR